MLVLWDFSHIFRGKNNKRPASAGLLLFLNIWYSKNRNQNFKIMKNNQLSNENFKFYLILGGGIGLIFFVVCAIIALILKIDGYSLCEVFKFLYIAGFFCGIFGHPNPSIRTTPTYFGVFFCLFFSFICISLGVNDPNMSI